MTPGARVQAAIDILADSIKGPLPADAVANAYFRRRRYAGGGDRRAVRALVFDVLRRKARLEWHLARLGAAPSPRLLMLADLIVGDGSNAVEVEALYGSSPHAPQALSDDERRLAAVLAGRPLDDPAMPGWVRREYPAWLEDSLKRAFGDRLAAEMEALNRPAPLDLRVNAIKATREKARAALAAEGIETEPTPLSPWGLRAKGAARVSATRVFKDGLVEIQDEGSQVAALMVGARPGMTTIDYCAGAGGKTLALAATMSEGNVLRGRLIACDAAPERLERMAARLARAGIEGARRIVLDADDSAAALAEFRGAADRVLLDVPCSGSGAWRRDPLAKWRLTPETLAGLRARQGRILAAAAPLVRPGGRLVYVTCSVLPEENENPVRSFAQANEGFRIVPAERAGIEILGAHPSCKDQFLRLSPAADGTDGFFVAVLERAPT